MSKKVADIIVETLQSAGVRHCYGVVGDTLNLIARSLEPRSSGSRCAMRKLAPSPRRPRHS
jgi:thiamine pyrophosphate-dependent acetolactate synthase large subunit-like protein